MTGLNLQTEIQQDLERIDLRSRGMLVTLHLRCYQARKYDRKASKETTDNHQASSEAGRFNKKLIDTDKYLKPIQKLQNEIRGYHYDRTLPWREGDRLLNIDTMEEFAATMNDFEDQQTGLVDTFIGVWPHAVEEARNMLGTLFNPEEYPSVRLVREKFEFSIEYSPIPDTSDFRVQLPEHVIQATAGRIQDRYQRAQEDAWQRLHGCVKDIADKLEAFDRGDQKCFRDTLITNLSDLARLMPGLNIHDDPALRMITRKAAETLTKVNPADLRKDKGARQEISQAARDILDKMAIR